MASALIGDHQDDHDDFDDAGDYQYDPTKPLSDHEDLNGDDSDNKDSQFRGWRPNIMMRIVKINTMLIMKM